MPTYQRTKYQHQISTPNQTPSRPLNQTLRENQLPETTSLEDVAHIRVVNKNGASQKIAHTKLKQNIIPSFSEQLTGEYWRNSDGTIEAVYIKLVDITSRYHIVNGNQFRYTVTFPKLVLNVKDFISVNGYYNLNCDNSHQDYIGLNHENREFVLQKDSNGGISAWLRYREATVEMFARLRIVLKYTKTN